MVSSGQDDWMVDVVELPPGEQSYVIIEDGVARRDPFEPLTTFEGDREVTLTLAPDCHSPSLHIDAITPRSDGSIELAATFTASVEASALDASHIDVTPSRGQASILSVDPSTGKLSVLVHDAEPGKLSVSLSAFDSDGRAAPPARAIGWSKPQIESFQDATIYQIMLDRYRGAGGAVLAPPANPGARAGGTLDGVRAEVEKGTFESLGVSVLWLSPVYENPKEPRVGRDGHMSESYHGYWPQDTRKVDARLGGDAALHALVDAAHAHGLRVLLDIVPNHVYEKNSRYLQHGAEGWFHVGPTACVCGESGCSWGDFITTCEFATYLPDYRFEDAEVRRIAAEDAAFWRDTFDIDGFRIDAIPMMPRLATRFTMRSLRDSLAPRQASFSIGEVYTGPGLGGLQSIKYHLGADGLDAAFHFPLMWSMRDALATDRAGLDAIEAALAAGEQQLQGSGSLLGVMMDNHDTSRFVSEADGTAGADPWSAAPAQPTSPDVYARHAMALTLLFASPGIPVLYYGDEVGLAGAGDPDSRRVMPDDAALLPLQKDARSLASNLANLRRCSPALRRGARAPLRATSELLAFSRDAGDGQPVYAIFSKATGPMSLALPLPAGDWADALTGEVVDPTAISVSPRAARLITPTSNPCIKKKGS
jgi:glycosidase